MSEEQKKVVREFVEFTGNALKPFLDRLGLVIYSKPCTLTLNPVMFWGFNPGQDPTVVDATAYPIKLDLESFPHRNQSLLDTVWPDSSAQQVRRGPHGIKYFSRHYREGEAPYQKGTKTLLGHIGHPFAIVTNFVFQQTAKEDDVRRLSDFKLLVQCCSIVHRRMFEIARPKVLFTTAGVLDLLRLNKFIEIGTGETGPWSGYSRSNVAKWEATSEFGPLTILQIPHMSYWGNIVTNPRNQTAAEALGWLKLRVEEAVGILTP